MEQQMMLSPPAPSRIRDVSGLLWDVHHVRPTPYGFDLFWGHPIRSQKKRNPRLIASPGLVAFWNDRRTDCQGNYNLPATDGVLARMRKDLGFHSRADRRDLLGKPVADLRKLQSSKFAEHYGVPTSMAIRWRAALLNSVNRPRDRWKDPSILALIRSNLCVKYLAEALGISYALAIKKRQELAPGFQPKKEIFPRGIPPKWRNPRALEILRSGLTSRQAAASLGISISHVQRLRYSLAHNPEFANPGDTTSISETSESKNNGL